MAHGTPDELNVKSDLTAVLGYTIPETIARLHSAIQYGLPGEVQSVQTWENGIAPWFVELSPGDPYGYLSSDYAVSDGVSMRLYTTADAAEYVVLGRVNPYTEDTHFSLTCHVCFVDFVGFLGFFIRIQQNATAYVFRLDLTEATDQVAIQSLGAGTVVLGTMALFGESEGLFNTVKIVVDVANLEYVSVTINGVVFDLAGDTPLEEGGAGIESIETFLLWSGSDDNAQSLYVDNLSIAHNDT